MKREYLSLKGVFLLMGAGTAATALALCAVTLFVTKSVTAAAVCLLTAAVLSVWGLILVRVLHNRLTVFTNDVCRMIDDMMGERTPSGMIFDRDTLPDRIGHRLSRLYQMLQNSRKTLEEQRADLQCLISDISHQVKTPAANLKMAATTLLEQELCRSRQTDYLQSMCAQVDKLDFLMRALIKSSRLETGVITLKKRPYPIYETLADALGGIFRKAEEKRLRVAVDCPKDLQVPCDPGWTAEALFNILENAVKYTPAEGSIRVSVSRWEACTKIDISDTGRGIPERAQGAIFQRFYREPEVHETEGLGIGLYLAREIISRQGGHIMVNSEVGKGATFAVFLPDH